MILNRRRPQVAVILGSAEKFIFSVAVQKPIRLESMQ